MTDTTLRQLVELTQKERCYIYFVMEAQHDANHGNMEMAAKNATIANSLRFSCDEYNALADKLKAMGESVYATAVELVS